MTPLEQEVLEIGLRSFFKKSFLSVCTLDELLKLAQVVPPAREMQTVRVLHCVEWSAMSEGVRSEISRLIVSWFGLPAFDPLARPVPQLPAMVEIVVEAKRQGFFSRLLGPGQVQ